MDVCHVKPSAGCLSAKSGTTCFPVPHRLSWLSGSLCSSRGMPLLFCSRQLPTPSPVLIRWYFPCHALFFLRMRGLWEMREVSHVSFLKDHMNLSTWLSNVFPSLLRTISCYFKLYQVCSCSEQRPHQPWPCCL